MENEWGKVSIWQAFRREAEAYPNLETRAAAIALCEAMIPWCEGRGPRPDPELAVKALRHRSNRLAPHAGIALGLLAEAAPDPESLLTRAFRAAPAKSRAIFLRWVRAGEHLPRSVFLTLAGMGLEDRSHEVRLFAIELADSKQLAELIPVLRRMRSGTDAEYVDRTIALIEQGYFLQPEPEFSSWSVDLRMPDGTWGFSVPDRVLKAIGIERMLERAREYFSGKREDLEWDDVAA